MCDICLSTLLNDVNKKINWRPDRVVKWAGRRGLAINEKQLENHFKKHIDSAAFTEGKAGKTLAKKKKAKSGQTRSSTKSIKPENRSAAAPSALDKHNAADEQLLSEVVKQVFGSLAEGNYSLKIEHGFKAIELRQKLADTSDAETLLLDLLNEIRRQELELNR